jgi:hypothetical protein
MENIKLHASPHPTESAVAYLEIWDAAGDSWDLAGRCSLNLRHQNLRCPVEHRCRPAARLLLDVVVQLLHLLLDVVVLLCLLCRLATPPPPPPPQPTTHHLCPITCN